MGEPEVVDAIVIGTGQAGKPLAVDLAESGRKTVIVERDRVGGTCVVRGCTPTKTMVASARVAHVARRAGDYGVDVGSLSVDMEAVRRRKREIVDSWSRGSREGLEDRDGLELVDGEARFTAPHEVAVSLTEGESRRFRADEVFIDTGARPAVPPITGLDEVPFLDSTSIMELDRVPEHLMILGGGMIGLEFGQMFRRFGADVTVVERADRLALREDEDVSEAIREIFEDEGIRVLTGREALAVRAEGDGIALEVREDDATRELEGSHLLAAVGRTPNSDALDPDRAGLETDDRGHIQVDDRCETGVPGIWAMGDVTGAPPFTHIAYDDYRIVRENLLGGGSASREGRVLPYTVFIDPQLGRIGPTEKEAREAGRNVRVAKLPMARVARAMEVDETAGFMKAVVDADTDRILGAAILGIEGGEVAAVIQAAMLGDLPYTRLRDAPIAHPTLAESLNNLFMALDE